MTTTIQNRGQQLILQVVQTLPPGAQLIELEPSGVISETPSGKVATWNISFAPNETKQLQSRVRAPAIAGTFGITTTTGHVVDSTVTKLETNTFEMSVKNETHLLLELLAHVSGLVFSDSEKITIKNVLIGELGRAQLAMMASSDEELLRILLVVQDRLARIDPEGTQAILLARLIGIVEWRLSK